MLKELISQYILLLEDYGEIKAEYIILRLRTMIVFKNDQDTLNKLDIEVNQYLNSIKKEISIYNFILKNIFKINVSDFNYVLNNLDDEFEIKSLYIRDILDNLDIALGIEQKERFYLYRKKFQYIDNDKEKIVCNQLKGFNDFNLMEFINGEGILETDEFFEILNNAKKLDCDAKENEDMFGIFENNDKNYLLIPKIKDIRSFLICIHEFTHMALLKNKGIIRNEEVVNSEIIPIFYELLFKKTNPFVKENIHTNDISIRLLKEYRDETFLEQVEKAKYYIKKN